MADVRYQYRGYEVEPGPSWMASYLDSWMTARLPLVKARIARDLSMMPAEDMLDLYKKIIDGQVGLADKSMWLAGTASQGGVSLQGKEIQAQSAANTAATNASIARFQGQTDLTKQARGTEGERQNSAILSAEDIAMLNGATDAGLSILPVDRAATPAEIAAAVQQVARESQAKIAGIENPLHRGVAAQMVIDRIATRAGMSGQTDPAMKQAFEQAVSTYLTTPLALVVQNDADGVPVVQTRGAYDTALEQRGVAPAAPGSPGYQPSPLTPEANVPAAPAPAAAPVVPAGGRAPVAAPSPRSLVVGPPGPAPAPAPAAPAASSPATTRYVDRVAPAVPSGAMTTYRTTSGLPVLDAAEAARGDIPIAREALGRLSAQEQWVLDNLGQGSSREEATRRGTTQIDFFDRAPDPKRQAAIEKIARYAAANPDKMREFEMLTTERAQQKAPDPSPVPRYVEQARSELRKAEGEDEDAATGTTAELAGKIGQKWADFTSNVIKAGLATRNPDGSLTYSAEGEAERDKTLNEIAALTATRGFSPAGAYAVIRKIPMDNADKGKVLARVSRANAEETAMKQRWAAEENAKVSADIDTLAAEYKAEGEKDEKAVKSAAAEDERLRAKGMSAVDRAVAFMAKAKTADPVDAKALTEMAKESDARTWTAADRALQRQGIPTAYAPPTGPAITPPANAAKVAVVAARPPGTDAVPTTPGMGGAVLPGSGGAPKLPAVTVVAGSEIGDERAKADAYRTAVRARLGATGLTGPELDAAVEERMVPFFKVRKRRALTTPTPEDADAP